MCFAWNSSVINYGSSYLLTNGYMRSCRVGWIILRISMKEKPLATGERSR